VNLPAHRFSVQTGGTWETARLFSHGAGMYARTEWSTTARWFPRARGRDYETVATVGYGAVFGKAPLDERFMLTYNQDYNLPLRAHSSTRRGKRGSAPIGDRYLLANFDLYKELWQGSFLTLDAGPIADIGTVWRPVRQSDSGKVFVDVGAQIRLRLPAGFSVVVSYARDLRSGSGVFNSFLR
jgi:hypothetical protein